MKKKKSDHSAPQFSELGSDRFTVWITNGDPHRYRHHSKKVLGLWGPPYLGRQNSMFKGRLSISHREKRAGLGYGAVRTDPALKRTENGSIRFSVRLEYR